jgi:hypothetical protein
MAISISKYVDIVSGVGGAGTVRQRDLIGRIFTANPRVPIDSVVELTTAADAATYFGSSSEEYARALFYFSWISKNISSPRKLQFARWAEVASVPRIYGSRLTVTLADLNLITTGTLSLTAGANTASLTGLDFSGAASFAAIATILQTAIRAATGAQFATAVVTYDATAGAFNFAGTVAEEAPISVLVTGTVNDIATRIGWGPSAVFSPGVDVTSLTDTLNTNADLSTNFGSFLFMPELTTDEVVEVAEWNGERNVEFMYCVRCDDTNRAALGAALISIPGNALTYAPIADQYDEMIPMTILAATDYTRRNSVQNYMFQLNFDGITAKVSTNTLSAELDALRINYYGVTQTAGQLIAFYQRGVLGGGTTDPTDQNTYANEMWLKDTARAVILSLLLSVGRIPANASGRGALIAVLQEGAIDPALFNGVISVDKALTTVQKLYITDITGDDLAWYQVQDKGYWLNAEMQSYVTTDGRTEFKAVYTLVYAKDDAIRKVEGTHILI